MNPTGGDAPSLETGEVRARAAQPNAEGIKRVKAVREEAAAARVANAARDQLVDQAAEADPGVRREPADVDAENATDVLAAVGRVPERELLEVVSSGSDVDDHRDVPLSPSATPAEAVTSPDALPTPGGAPEAPAPTAPGPDNPPAGTPPPERGELRQPVQSEAAAPQLTEEQILAHRQEAKDKLGKLDNPQSEEYKKAKEQFDATNDAARKHYARELLQHDSGLQALLRRNGYDLKVDDIDTIMRKLREEKMESSPLYRRLEALNGQAKRAALAEGTRYDIRPEDATKRADEMAEAAEHERGPWRRRWDGFNDVVAKFSGAEVRAAFTQAKALKQKMKVYEEQLKNPELKEQIKEELLRSKGIAEGEWKAMRKEAREKNIVRWVVIIWFMFAAGLVVGPTVGTAKLLELIGKGGK